MSNNCGDFWVESDSYDPRGRGVEYYVATCKKCNKRVKYSEHLKGTIIDLFKNQVCPETEKERTKKRLSLEIHSHETILTNLKLQLEKLENES